MAVSREWDRNREPHRTLRSGHRGDDVKALQEALRLRLKRAGLPYKGFVVDGEFGPQTRRAWIANGRTSIAYLLGLNHRLCTAGNQGLVRWPWRRPDYMKRREDKRKAALRATLSTNPGQLAVKAALTLVGKVETGYNDSPWLRRMEAVILRAGYALGWMIPGQPYCGFGCIWAWLTGAGVKLPPGTVYTPNICPWRGKKIGRVRFRSVALEQARPGDLLVFNFGSGGAKHVALARGPMRGGVIPTVEFNTSAGNTGSQANGGGVWKRNRSRGLILCAVHVAPERG